MKKKYEISTGSPSWHQLKAGHLISSVIVLSLDESELETFKKNHFNETPCEPLYIKELK
jgi:hypothetical protein